MTRADVLAYIMERLQCDRFAAENILSATEDALALRGKGHTAFMNREAEVLAEVDKRILRSPALTGNNSPDQWSMPLMAFKSTDAAFPFDTGD